MLYPQHFHNRSLSVTLLLAVTNGQKVILVVDSN